MDKKYKSEMIKKCKTVWNGIAELVNSEYGSFFKDEYDRYNTYILKKYIYADRKFRSDRAYCPFCEMAKGNSKLGDYFNCQDCLFYKNFGDRCFTFGYSYFMTRDQIIAFDEKIQSIPEE